MAFRNSFNENDCDENRFAMMVDKMLGSAYSVVKSVADNLKYVLQVSTYMDQIVDLVDFKQRLLIQNSLGALGATTLIPLPADIPLDDVVNISVNVRKTTGEFYGDESAPVDIVASGTNIAVTLKSGADPSFANCKAFVRVSYSTPI